MFSKTITILPSKISAFAKHIFLGQLHNASNLAKPKNLSPMTYEFAKTGITALFKKWHSPARYFAYSRPGFATLDNSRTGD
jgi:hypothetical protein